MKTSTFKALLISFISAISMSSCTSYYYSMINTNSHGIDKNELGDFVINNDSIQITYNFGGESAPIGIEIYNNSDNPLYIDWVKSSLIIDDMATSLKENDYPNIHGTIRSSSSTYHGYTNTDGTFTGRVNVPDNYTYIPPKSKISEVPLELSDFPFDQIPNKEYTQSKYGAKEGSIAIKSKNFTYYDSPLAFKTYLVLYSGFVVDESKPLIFEHDFYVSKLIKTSSMKPTDMYVNNSNRMKGDTFYLKKTKGTEVAGAIGLIGLLGITIFLGLEYDPDLDNDTDWD